VTVTYVCQNSVKSWQPGVRMLRVTKQPSKLGWKRCVDFEIHLHYNVMCHGIVSIPSHLIITGTSVDILSLALVTGSQQARGAWSTSASAAVHVAWRAASAGAKPVVEMDGIDFNAQTLKLWPYLAPIRGPPPPRRTPSPTKPHVPHEEAAV